MRAGIGVRLFACLIALLFVAPTLIVAATSVTSGTMVTFPPKGFSLRWFQEVLTDPEWLTALGNSVQVGLLAAALAMAAGTSLAFAAARSRFLPPALVTGLAVLPMTVPLVVAGIGFYLVYIRVGLSGNVLSLGIAHAVLGLPFVFVNVLAALTGVDRRVEEAARVSGATEAVTLLRITLPLVAPAALVGGVLAFVSSWDEVVVALFLNTPQFRTLPVVMWSQVRSGVEPSISAVATLITLVSLLMAALVLVGPAVVKKVRRRT
ncbi:ABC transporter permease [Microbispora amethystogenes]|nr:ABC transporter permease [Microbispora amethystogenes]